jgi:hypothetical protein
VSAELRSRNGIWESLIEPLPSELRLRPVLGWAVTGGRRGDAASVLSICGTRELIDDGRRIRQTLHVGSNSLRGGGIGRIVEDSAGSVADGPHRNLIWLQGDTCAYARHLLGVDELVRPAGRQIRGTLWASAPLTCLPRHAR